jgi:4-diphosphocytidyl-2-C-methyl-D-erythritol kinase
MKTPFHIEAPAKINLSLRVLGKREDGFHEVETLMVRLPGLHDILSVEEAGEFCFECDEPSVPSDESNLVVRAARLFERRTGMTCRIKVRLEKRVPHGAGLGGGSSDAAAMLVALDRLSGAGIGAEKLAEWTAELGSDVAFFTGSGPAWCRGRGEILETAAGIPALPVLLLKPGFGVATPDAYSRWSTAPVLPGIRHEPASFAWGDMVNDLERPVFSKHLFLAEMKIWLSRRHEVAAAMMSGSGSTMIAVLKDMDMGASLAAAARAQLDPALWSWCGVTEGVNGTRQPMALVVPPIRNRRPRQFPEADSGFCRD